MDFGWASGIGESLRWDDLIREYRIVILSEAGSGKTTEIRHIARSLRGQNKQVFFLRLEYVARNFEIAFEVGSYEEFEDWLNSEEEGWLLLDSVDEARLRDPRDFELAIRVLGHRIQSAINRAHIVITSRPAAWRHNTDLNLCGTHLPHDDSASEHKAQTYDCETDDDHFKVKTEDNKNVKPVFRVVTLEDLTDKQIAAFVEAKGVSNGKAFLNEVERADAWSFTSRPQDLEELIETWIGDGQFGTGLDIVQNSLARRLVERDQDRAEAGPLSPDRVRQGAKLLAAATTLTHIPTIRIPDGANNATGIPVQSLLDDWDDKEQTILLSRPVFDEANYGTVSFHHRSVREYLTAKWFEELLKNGSSRRTIERLFFQNQYGLDVIVPTLRPILPWLAIFDGEIRERVYKIAPEIFFEGGDPSQLPLELRQLILRDVCEQIARGATGRSMGERAALQRFAKPDLTDDVLELIRKYKDNDELTEFLLHMVWIGQLKGAKQEVIDLAMKSTSEHYVRLAAFRATNVLGSDADKERVRKNFQEEASEIKRDWLAELVDGVRPTEKTLSWLLACLEKTSAREQYSVDHLTEQLTEFVMRADIELLPKVINDFNRLFNLPPIIEPGICNVSKRFIWLLDPASRAAERLISARHLASLKPCTLDVLDKLSTADDYMDYRTPDFVGQFSKIVPAWPELNRALFWFGVERARKTIDKAHGERLTKFWQIIIFNQFWVFKVSDFDYLAEEIVRRDFIDDKLIALSLAIEGYKAAGRPDTWRVRLKNIVKGDSELSTRLDNYLNPPAQNAESRRLKQREIRLKRRHEARQKQLEKYHADWKQWFNDNLVDAQAKLRDSPGIITRPMHYLFEKTRGVKDSTMRWTEYNWKTLIPEYGDDVARFYRDSVVSFWRHHIPKLRSEGAPLDQTTHAVVIGLTGLEIEAHEVKDWTRVLSPDDVELACRYASFELNGFPTWFPKLFETHPEVVSKFLMKEINNALSIEHPEKEITYILRKVCWSGQWAWDELALGIYDLLEKEPKKLSILDHLLIIVQGSSLSDELIEKLASRKCRTLAKLNHLARWFAVWTGVCPEDAIASLTKRISEIEYPQEQSTFAMIYLTHLLGSRISGGGIARQAVNTPEHLKSLYLLMNDYIRPDEDIDHVGGEGYTPNLRDEAQEARDSLFNLLNQLPGKKTYLALNELAMVHPKEKTRKWISLQAKRRGEQDSDLEPWSPEQVKDFNEQIERTPQTHKELAELAVLRLLDLKDDLEHGDESIAVPLLNVTHETDLRNSICWLLKAKSNRRYSIVQEGELADGKKTGPEIPWNRF